MAGDEILSADGAPFAEIGSFKGKAGPTVTLDVLRKAGGAPIAVPVTVEKIEPLGTYLKAITDSVKVVERDGRKIGVIHLWTYTSDEVSGILNEELATRLKDVDGLVLDLRSRWGGAPADAAESFVGGTADMEVIDNDGETHYVNTRFHKPVVAIIDEGTRSGMEILAYSLKKNGVPLVGAADRRRCARRPGLSRCPTTASSSLRSPTSWSMASDSRPIRSRPTSLFPSTSATPREPIRRSTPRSAKWAGGSLRTRSYYRLRHSGRVRSRELLPGLETRRLPDYISALRSNSTERSCLPTTRCLLPGPVRLACRPSTELKPEHFRPAFDAEMTGQIAAIDEIVRNKEAPTFDNTIVALELSGLGLDKVAAVFFHLATADTNEALQAVEREIAPLLARHGNAIYLNEPLFRRIEAVWKARERPRARAEARGRPLPHESSSAPAPRSTPPARSGSRRSPSGSRRSARSSARTCSPTRAASCWCWTARRISPGCRSPSSRSPRKPRNERGLPGKHVITLSRSSIEPFLQFSTRRDLREKAFEAWIKRGEFGGKTDNRAADLRDDLAPRRAGEAAGLRELRPFPPRRHDGEDAGGGERAAEFRLGAGAGTRRGGGEGAAGPGRGRRRQLPHRRLGLAALRRAGAQGASSISTRRS